MNVSQTRSYLLEGIETPRLSFRRVESSDYDTCLPFFQHPLSHQYWDVQGKDAVALCSEWITKQQHRYANDLGGALALVDKESNVLVGWCGLLVQTVDSLRELEVGYSIMPEHWRKGFASEASSKCIEVAFQRRLADSIISIIQVDNVPSRRVAEKNGMTVDRQSVYHGNAVFIYRIERL